MHPWPGDTRTRILWNGQGMRDWPLCCILQNRRLHHTMTRPLMFFQHQVPNYEKGLQSLIQIFLSILNTVFVCNYDIESSYQKRKKMHRWIHVRLFLEYPKNTQVIMYTLLTCQWYQLHLTRFCILLPCLFITYKNSICFIGFHVLHVNKNLT